MLFALMATGFTIGILYFLFVSPYLLAKGLFMIEYGDCYGSDKIKCMIPVYNLYIAEKLYSDRFPIISLSGLFTILFFISRIVIMFIFPTSVFSAMISLGLFSLCFLIFWISSSILVYSLLDKTESVYGAKKLLSVIMFPLGEFYIGNYLATTIRNEMNAKEAI